MAVYCQQYVEASLSSSRDIFIPTPWNFIRFYRSEHHLLSSASSSLNRKLRVQFLRFRWPEKKTGEQRGGEREEVRYKARKMAVFVRLSRCSLLEIHVSSFLEKQTERERMYGLVMEIWKSFSRFGSNFRVTRDAEGIWIFFRRWKGRYSEKMALLDSKGLKNREEFQEFKANKNCPNIQFLSTWNIW